MKNNQIYTGGAVVFKDVRGKRYFLVVKHKDEDKWEIAKATARRGESSVRAAIRITSELGGMNARVLEEAGRASGAATINGKGVLQKIFYYIMVLIASGEVLGFSDHKWLEYSKALKLLTLKREKEMLKNTKVFLKTWDKERKSST